MKGRLEGESVFGPSAAESSGWLAAVYHENTKLHPVVARYAARGSTTPGHVPDDRPRSGQGRLDAHAKVPRIDLPSRERDPWLALTFPEAVARRRSLRRFGPDRLSLEAVSTVLRTGYGVVSLDGPPAGTVRPRRAVPSAGALYPLEVYVAICHAEGLVAGLYHYAPTGHALYRLSAGDCRPVLLRLCMEDSCITTAGMVILIAAKFARTTSRYGDRGYRHVLIEAGHVGQSIALTCAALGLESLPIGGYYDDVANVWLGLDGVDEAVCHMVAVGSAAEPRGLDVPSASPR